MDSNKVLCIEWEMSLLDHFAGIALNSIYTAPWHPEMGCDWRQGTDGDVSKRAYDIAQSMVDERERRLRLQMEAKQ
jgi:hypothetical protein